jgi:hypothetical protein
MIEEAPLTQSGIAEHVWAFYHTDQAEFMKLVTEYFALGYPGWRVVKANYKRRIIWIRDDRRKNT